jgi:small subunit ribosomal protein S6
MKAAVVTPSPMMKDEKSKSLLGGDVAPVEQAEPAAAA